MNSQSMISRVVIGGSLAAFALVGCASTQDDKSMAMKKAPAESVAERQRLMKLHGALMRDISQKARANNIEAIEVSAETLALSAQRIAAAFPEGSMTPQSKAKPEVWSKRSEFEAAAKKLETEAVRLRDAAKAKNAQATQDIVKDFGRTTCDGCHTPFRVPPARS
jgi:cytochrome c556